MQAMTNLINQMIPYIIGIVLVVIVIKFILGMMRSRQKRKKVKKPRDDAERIFAGLIRGAKTSSLMSRTSVYVTGDSITRAHKIGETMTGIIPFNDEYVFFMRKKWWYFWVKPICVHVEPELMSDLIGGEIWIRGRGVDPLNDRDFYIIPPTKHATEHKPEEIEKRRSRVRLGRMSRLLNDDLNTDISYAVKSAFRGAPELAHRELYQTSDLPERSQEQLEREQERERVEMIEDSRKGRTYIPNYFNQEGGL